jgi:hypothetical protein
MAPELTDAAEQPAGDRVDGPDGDKLLRAVLRARLPVLRVLRQTLRPGAPCACVSTCPSYVWLAALLACETTQMHVLETSLLNGFLFSIFANEYDWSHT